MIIICDMIINKKVSKTEYHSKLWARKTGFGCAANQDNKATGIFSKISEHLDLHTLFCLEHTF